jgi:MFS family permease
MAAVLQSAVNVGVLIASVAVYFMSGFPSRYVFLIGIVPALIVFWIRKAVPEPEEWHAAKADLCTPQPVTADLFRGKVRRTTLLTITVCAFSLTAHWAFMFWAPQHLSNLPDVKPWGEKAVKEFVSMAMMVIMLASIAGNFLAASLAKLMGYRRAILVMCLAYFGTMLGSYAAPHDYRTLFHLLWAVGVCQGVFGLFTMYLPPLFPTLIRTTGAGFCYNIGRIAAGLGTVYFGTFTKVGDYRITLFYAAFLFLPAAVAVLFMSEPPDERPAPQGGIVD